MTKFRARFGKSKTLAQSLGIPAAPKPQPAPAPAPSPAPWDTQYEQTKTSLIQGRDSALSNVAADQTRLQSNYGYNMDGSENTSDPYSRLAQLRADYEKIKRGAGVNYAARGQLYSGAYQNQINADQEAQNRSIDALRKDFGDQSASLRNRSSEIWNTYGQGLTAASNARIDSAANDVADGSSPVATPNTRMQAVLSALAGKLSPSHRDRLRKEAKKNGWITA